MNKYQIFSLKYLHPKQFIMILLVVALVSGLIASWVYLKPYPADTYYLNTIKVMPDIHYQEFSKYIQITPAQKSGFGIIFYPGGLVEPAAYAYKWANIARQTSATVFIAKFPLNLALTDINAASEIINNNPNIKTWGIAGHSLGGAMACRYVKSHPGVFKWLWLQASYCDQSIVDQDIEVILTIGDQDNILNRDTYQQSKQNLPNGFKEIIIPEMNHSQFGNYGIQSGDNPSLVDDSKIVAELTNLLSTN